MSLKPTWVPMKWQCGPSEIEHLRVDENRDLALRESAVRWADPSALRLLQGSPINCLVVDWASGSTVDAAQQSALQPLIEAGRRLGLSFVGRISAKENLAAVVDAGHAAGLDAVMLEKLPGIRLALPYLVPCPNDDMEWSQVTDIYRATGALWPGGDLQTTEDNSAFGGPTGIPNVKSNGWFSLMSREIAPGKIPWMDIDPPASAQMLPAAEYRRAIADSRIHGSHWIVSLDPWLRKGLLVEDKIAVETWARIIRELDYFGEHAEWREYRPMGMLAVVSDFAGLNAISSGAVLNFLSESQTQFVAVDRLRMKGLPSAGLKAVVWMDDAEPSAAQREQMLQFVRGGGLVIAPKYWGPAGVTTTEEDWMPEYRIYSLEKGRMVVAKAGLQDPYQLSLYAHLLVGRRNDFARLFNPQMTNCISSLHPDGQRQIVQLVNYGPKPVEYMSLWVNAKARSGTLVSPESESSLPLECIPSSGGTEFHIAKLTVSCAIAFERVA
jgi:hypothetical protein